MQNYKKDRRKNKLRLKFIVLTSIVFMFFFVFICGVKAEADSAYGPEIKKEGYSISRSKVDRGQEERFSYYFWRRDYK